MNIELYDWAMSQDYVLLRNEKKMLKVLTSFPVRGNLDFVNGFKPENFVSTDFFKFVEIKKRCYCTPFQEVFEECADINRIPYLSIESRVRRFCDSVNFVYTDIYTLINDLYYDKMSFLDIPPHIMYFFTRSLDCKKLMKKIDQLKDFYISMNA